MITVRGPNPDLLKSWPLQQSRVKQLHKHQILNLLEKKEN